MAGGAVDPVPLLAALEHRPVDREREPSRRGLPSFSPSAAGCGRRRRPVARVGPRDRAGHQRPRRRRRRRRTCWPRAARTSAGRTCRCGSPAARAGQDQRRRRAERDRRSDAHRRELASVFERIVSVSDSRNELSRVHRKSPSGRRLFQELARLLGVEHRVARLDAEEEPVRDASAKLGHVEHRVVAASAAR